MNICDTLWCHTDQVGAATVWAALIALVGAVLVFYGAWRIGVRQMSILAEQAEIQRDQARIQKQALDLEHLKVRTDLFDRRMEIYEATRDWVDFVAIHGRSPFSLAPDEVVSDEQRNHEIGVLTRFHAARDKSRFLFSDHVWKALCGLSREGNKHARLQRRLAHLTSREDPDVVMKEMNAVLDRIAEVDSQLVDIFGDEIRLTLPQEQ